MHIRKGFTPALKKYEKHFKGKREKMRRVITKKERRSTQNPLFLSIPANKIVGYFFFME